MSKINDLAGVIKDDQVDAVLVTNLINVRYLTGFTGSSAMLLVHKDSEAFLITDFRYTEQANEQTVDCEVIILKDGFSDELAKIIEKKAISSLAFEPNSLTYAKYSDLSKKLNVELQARPNLVEDLRAVKTPDEIESLQAACSVTSKSMVLAMEMITVPRVTEKDIAYEIECFMKKNGAEDVAFAPIVASGPNSAKPHAVVTDREIQKGDLIVVDIGARYNGYCGDMTRTFCLGKASGEQKEVYEIVKRSQEAVFAGDILEKTGNNADAIARDIIRDAGYGEQFGHGLGHGIGLEPHEQPSLSPRSEKSILTDDMAFTIEPGIYIQGQFGVRIEDSVVSSGGTLRSLTEFTHDLVEL